MNKQIDSYSLRRLLKTNNINLIDIRPSYIYSSGTIGNAKNVPANYLMTNPTDYLNKDNEYYIFCNYGNTSTIVCSYLEKLGYNVVNVIDGYQGYKDSIM